MVPFILMASMTWSNGSTRKFIQFGRNQDQNVLDWCIRAHTGLHTGNASSKVPNFQSIWGFQ
jgi:hypothetical protein